MDHLPQEDGLIRILNESKTHLKNILKYAVAIHLNLNNILAQTYKHLLLIYFTNRGANFMLNFAKRFFVKNTFQKLAYLPQQL